MSTLCRIAFHVHVKSYPFIRLSVIVGTKKTGTSRSHGAVEDSYPVAIDVFLG